MSLSVRWGSRSALALTFVPLAAFGLPERTAYVIGSNDQSVTRVDLDSGEVLANVAHVGSTPNRIEVSQDLSLALIVNSGSDDVTFLDLEDEQILGTSNLPAGCNPWAVEFAGPRAFVSCLLAERIYELDTSSGVRVDSTATGVAPEGMCIARGKLYVANTGFDFDDFTYAPGTVSVIPLSNLSAAQTIPVGLNPQECFVVPSGDVHVVCTGDFFLTTGSVHVIDPATDAPLDTLEVPAFPGGGAVDSAGEAFLNVTTLAFGSEIWSYDSDDLTWTHDGSQPLLPSPDFYGNIRLNDEGRLLVPDFSTDALLVHDPSAPQDTQVHFVGDGPIDASFVRRQAPVALLISGLRAENVSEGILLTWNASLEAGVRGFGLERKSGEAREFRRIATLPAAERASWIDRQTDHLTAYVYRVAVFDSEGGTLFSPPVSVLRDPAPPSRLALGRAFPNPTRGSVSLEILVPRAGEAVIEILDVHGRRVFARGESLPPGVSSWIWDGTNERGEKVTPGMYFACVSLGAETDSERILVVR